MLTRCGRNVLSGRAPSLKPPLAARHTSGSCSTTSSEEDADGVRTLLQLCVDRCYVSAGQTNTDLFQRGRSCSYGPLGMELRRNLLEQWWHSVTGSRAPVFGINSRSSSDDGEPGGQLRVVEFEHLKQILEQKDLSKEQLTKQVQMLLQRSTSVRTNLLQGKV